MGVLPGNVTQGCLLHETVANLYLCVFLLKCHINFVFMTCLESFSFPRCGVGSPVLLIKGIFFYIMLIFQLIVEVVTCEDSLKSLKGTWASMKCFLLEGFPAVIRAFRGMRGSWSLDAAGHNNIAEPLKALLPREVVLYHPWEIP